MASLTVEKMIPLIRMRLWPGRVDLGRRVESPKYGAGVVGGFSGSADRVEFFYVDYAYERVAYTPREIALLIYEGEETQ